MRYRRLLSILVLILIMGSTSCTTHRHSTRRIFIPDTEEVKMEELVATLSSVLGIPLQEEQDNIGLYAFVADWIGTPYRFGSNSKKGTDCSGFAYLLYLDVYETNISRDSSASLMKRAKPVNRNELQEGDLVFFNINNRLNGMASHVGVYLKNNLFAHASTRYGVTISSLNEAYYKQTYIGAGRLLK